MYLSDVDILVFESPLRYFRNMDVHYYVICIILFYDIHGCHHFYHPCLSHSCPPRPAGWERNHKGTGTDYIIKPTNSFCKRRWSPPLEMCNCGLTGVSEDAFYCLWNLKELDLRENRLQKVPCRTLRPLISLKTLILAGMFHNKYIMHNLVTVLFATLD